MSKLNNVRALLLEEALLFLLRNSGYETVDRAGKDPTLIESSSGLNVIGRGEKHQIDAIADFKSSPPFSNPQRLLVEAKCLDKNKKVGLPIIRNAVGVLIDVQEYFVPSNKRDIPNKIRYHYTYGMFSSNNYTFPAERYAYAHDIYLIPVARSLYFKPVIDSIYAISINDIIIYEDRIRLSELRMSIRESLRNESEFIANVLTGAINDKIKEFIKECKKINMAYIAIAGKTFPILLIPSPEFTISNLRNTINYKVRILSSEWFIESENGTKLFSFDLPKELINLYFEGGIFNQESALNLKEIELNKLKIIIEEENSIISYLIKLDSNWINLIRNSENFRDE